MYAYGDCVSEVLHKLEVMFIRDMVLAQLDHDTSCEAKECHLGANNQFGN